RIVELRSLATKSITRRAKRFWWHLMPGQARKSGQQLSRTTNPDTTSLWLRWSPEARGWWALRDASTEFAGLLPHSISISAKNCGERIPFPRLVSPAAKRGPKAISGRPEVLQSGLQVTTILKAICHSGEPATAARQSEISGRVITSIQPPRS